MGNSGSSFLTEDSINMVQSAKMNDAEFTSSDHLYEDAVSDEDSGYGNFVSAGDFPEDNIDNDILDLSIHDETLDVDMRDKDETVPVTMKNNQAEPSTPTPMDAYEDDEEDRDILFCSTKRQKGFNLPFQSCSPSSLAKRSLTPSALDDETPSRSIFLDTSHSEGDFMEKMNSKRRKKIEKNANHISFLEGKDFVPSALYPSVGTDPTYTEDELLMEDADEPTWKSDLKPKIVNVDGKVQVRCRSVHIITTASLPWMTGTAVNPLLRAAYLNKMYRTVVEDAIGKNHPSETYSMMGNVTLMIPFLVREEDQTAVYGNFMFSTQSEQEKHIRDWLRDGANLPLEADLETGGIRIKFYNAIYFSMFKSIFPTDCTTLLDYFEDEKCDVAILEEPEHLNCPFVPDVSFRHRFNHVVGIIHTNYAAYLKSSVYGFVTAPLFLSAFNLHSRYHCDVIIKLSSTIDSIAKEKENVSNCHGIRQDFLEEGRKRALHLENKVTIKDNNKYASDKIYFCGKLLWAKGFESMIELENAFKKVTGDYFPIDIVGSGPEEEEIRRAFHGNDLLQSISDNDVSAGLSRSSSVKERMEKLIVTIPKSRHELLNFKIPVNFLGRKDHASMKQEYKIFFNPSITEVLCTTTAEALAMGKFAIIPSHPSNVFFEQFPNCLIYNNKSEFISQMQFAIQNDPQPLSRIDILSWEAATERLIKASIITKKEEKRRERVQQESSDERAGEIVGSGIYKRLRLYLRNSCEKS